MQSTWYCMGVRVEIFNFTSFFECIWCCMLKFAFHNLCRNCALSNTLVLAQIKLFGRISSSRHILQKQLHFSTSEVTKIHLFWGEGGVCSPVHLKKNPDTHGVTKAPPYMHVCQSVYINYMILCIFPNIQLKQSTTMYRVCI